MSPLHAGTGFRANNVFSAFPHIFLVRRGHKCGTGMHAAHTGIGALPTWGWAGLGWLARWVGGYTGGPHHGPSAGSTFVGLPCPALP